MDAQIQEIVNQMSKLDKKIKQLERERLALSRKIVDESEHHYELAGKLVMRQEELRHRNEYGTPPEPRYGFFYDTTDRGLCITEPEFWLRTQEEQIARIEAYMATDRTRVPDQPSAVDLLAGAIQNKIDELDRNASEDRQKSGQLKIKAMQAENASDIALQRMRQFEDDLEALVKENPNELRAYADRHMD